MCACVQVHVCANESKGRCVCVCEYMRVHMYDSKGRYCAHTYACASGMRGAHRCSESGPLPSWEVKRLWPAGMTRLAPTCPSPPGTPRPSSLLLPRGGGDPSPGPQVPASAPASPLGTTKTPQASPATRHGGREAAASSWSSGQRQQLGARARCPQLG